MLNELVVRVVSSVTAITADFEIILVDDRSPDNSWAVIEELSRQDHRVRGIRLSRNFGQHHAITAGLEHSRGEWVIVMDCDLQDQPEEISALLAKAKQGYEIVLARRVERQDSLGKKIFSKIFYNTLAYLTGLPQDSAVANFGIYHRKAIDAISSMRESTRYFPTMVRWVGFRLSTLDVAHAERAEGSSSYNVKRLLNLALDVIIANSDKPLRLLVKVGATLIGLSLLFAVYVLFQANKVRFELLGYAGLIFSIWFLSGVLIFIIGVVGMYVGKVFEGVKARPVYIVDRLSRAQKTL